MDDFQAIQDIVNESVRNSSYISVVISSCIFIIYTLITKVVDYYKSKSRSKPLIEMATAIKENTANIVKLNSVLDKTLQDAERKERRPGSAEGIAAGNDRMAVWCGGTFFKEAY